MNNELLKIDERTGIKYYLERTFLYTKSCNAWTRKGYFK